MHYAAINTVKQHIDVGIMQKPIAVGPPKNEKECRVPGLPPGWQRPGGDPAGISYYEALCTAQSVIL